MCRRPICCGASGSRRISISCATSACTISKRRRRASAISMAIGALPTRLEDLMRAYAALADDGVMRELAFTRDERKTAAAARLVDRQRAARRLDARRSAGAAAVLSALRAARISLRRRGEDRHVAEPIATPGRSPFRINLSSACGSGAATPARMRAMTGVSSAARLAHAVLDKLHGAKPGDIAPETFAPPPGTRRHRSLSRRRRRRLRADAARMGEAGKESEPRGAHLRRLLGAT